MLTGPTRVSLCAQSMPISGLYKFHHMGLAHTFPILVLTQAYDKA